MGGGRGYHKNPPFLWGRGWEHVCRLWLKITFLKLWHCQIICYLFAGFKAIVLCSVHSIWFVKYVFSNKIWFVKTSTRIMKYEPRVGKSTLGPKINFRTMSRGRGKGWTGILNTWSGMSFIKTYAKPTLRTRHFKWKMSFDSG